jgi:hypothetical protein
VKISRALFFVSFFSLPSHLHHQPASSCSPTEDERKATKTKSRRQWKQPEPDCIVRSARTEAQTFRFGRLAQDSNWNRKLFAPRRFASRKSIRFDSQLAACDPLEPICATLCASSTSPIRRCSFLGCGSSRHVRASPAMTFRFLRRSLRCRVANRNLFPFPRTGLRVCAWNQSPTRIWPHLLSSHPRRVCLSISRNSR